MRAFPLHIALLAVAAILALAAAVSTVAAAEDPASSPASHADFQEHGEDGEGEATTTSAPGEDSGIDVVPVALGTAVGVVVGGAIFGVFYMLKRRVGGFPANPSWVAPITIMPSKDFPDDATYGHGDDHGHAPAGH